VAERLSSRLPLAGPILLSASLGIALALTLAGAEAVLGVAALYPALLGGFFEFYFLLALVRARTLLTGETWGDLRMVFSAAWPVPLFFTLVGAVVVGYAVRRHLEYIAEAPLGETPCARYYKPLVFVVTLGAYLAAFQACAGAFAAARLREVYAGVEVAPEGLGSEGDEGEEGPGGPDVPV